MNIQEFILLDFNVLSWVVRGIISAKLIFHILFPIAILCVVFIIIILAIMNHIAPIKPKEEKQPIKPKKEKQPIKLKEEKQPIKPKEEKQPIKPKEEKKMDTKFIMKTLDYAESCIEQANPVEFFEEIDKLQNIEEIKHQIALLNNVRNDVISGHSNNNSVRLSLIMQKIKNKLATKK